jgi:hypothetical protein
MRRLNVAPCSEGRKWAAMVTVSEFLAQVVASDDPVLPALTGLVQLALDLTFEIGDVCKQAIDARSHPGSLVRPASGK